MKKIIWDYNNISNLKEGYIFASFLFYLIILGLNVIFILDTNNWVILNYLAIISIVVSLWYII